MKLKDIINTFSVNPYDYEIFYNLSFSLRLLSLIALTCFNTVYLIIMHLNLKPFLVQSDYMSTNIIVAYSSVIIASILIFLPLIIEGLRPFKRTIIGVSRFIVIVFAIIIYNGLIPIKLDAIFTHQPRLLDYGIGIIGCLLNAFAIIIYAHLMKILTLDNAKKETEIKFAKKIQSQLVPTVFRNEETFQIFGITNTAFDIGGDFFDVINKDHHKILAVGDSTGHDIAAGLLMAITKGAFRTLVDEGKSFENLGKSLNKTIYENSDKKMFLTFSCGVFNMDENTVRFLNAGHMPVLHYNSQTQRIEEINSKGIAFGLMRNSDYETVEVKFNRGDTFFFMTDGIDEMKNDLNEEYGEIRVKKLLNKYAPTYSPKQIYEFLIKDVQIFTNFKEFNDDVSYLAIKIL